MTDGRGGFPGGNQARRETGDLEKRLENLVLWGFVEEIHEEAIMVRVRYGEKPENPDDPDYSVLSPWLKVAQGRFGNTRDAQMPEKGEWVGVLNTSGLVENGVVVFSLPYRNEDKDTGFVHAAKKADIERRIYGPVTKLKELVLNSFRTFTRSTAQYWHFLKSGGSFRIEIGKDTKTNTYLSIVEGHIEARVGTNKFIINEGGIGAFFNGNAASFEMDGRGLTVGLRKDHTFASVPNDKYEGTEGPSKGEGVGSVLETKKTTLLVQNGQIVATFDDKAQLVFNNSIAVATLHGGAQTLMTRNGIEAKVQGCSLALSDSVANIELGASRCTLTPGSGTLHVGSSRIMLTPEMIEAMMAGSSTQWKQSGIVNKAPDFKIIRGTAPGEPYTAVANPNLDIGTIEHPSTVPPSDLARPDIELGVKPFTPEM